MQHYKVAVDFISNRGKLIGTWSDYVLSDCDADGIIDMLYERRLVRLNWDKVRPVVRKGNRKDKLGWHRRIAALPVQVILAVAWIAICNYYAPEPLVAIIGMAWGLSWIIYIGAKQ